MRRSPLRRATSALSLVLAVAAMAPMARAAEPVKRIAIYVEPFYNAAKTAEEVPKVGVGGPYQPLLASNKRENIIAAKEMIVGKPAYTSPMTMMVLAIRLYDIGLRDDAVFWFYAAKDRYFTLREVIAPNTQALAQSSEAMNSFNVLAGPFINGYAFCDLDNQRAIRAKAVDWVEAHPYQAIFLEQLPARGPDRKALLADAVAKLRQGVAKEKAYLDDPAQAEAFKASRAKNEADAKFCWKN